jgi:hypothetical protein
MSIINKRKSKQCKTQCGDCQHFKKSKKKDFDDTCKNLGIIATSKTPECFEPDLGTFKKISNLSIIENLGELVKDFTPKQNRLLANFFIAQSRLKENRFYFGQPLFVCLGEEYLSHYYKGFVVGISKHEGTTYVNLVSQIKKSPNLTGFMLPESSVLNQKDFNTLAVDLLKQGKIVRDKKEFEHFRNLPLSDMIRKNGTIDVSKLIRMDLDVDVPTIDKAPKDVLEKKKKIKDLAEIFSEVSGQPVVTKLKTKRAK